MNDVSALLAELHPLEAPDVGIIPALGWWILLLLFIACCVLVGFLIKRYRRRRWLRDAKLELELLRQLPAESDGREFLTATSRLLRRVLIKRDSRAAVAALHGDEWLARLDSLLGENVFQSELGPLLSEGPYRRSTSLTDQDREALLQASASVIHRAGKSNA